MGWDVVQIGLRHNLPIHNPFATAKEVAKRMNQNIRLVYRNKYEYDKERNVISEAKNYFEPIELRKFEVNDSCNFLQMTVTDYQARQILGLVGMEKLRKVKFTSEFAALILDDINEPYELYEIEDDEENLCIRIFKENVDLDVSVIERWGYWEKAFHNLDQNRERLLDYRMQIYNRAQIFGCNEVLICSDQGPTINIYDNMDFTSEELKEYAHSFQYLKDSTWVKDSEKEVWKKNAKHIMFSSAFNDQLSLSNKEFVEIVYDDFYDLISKH